MLTKSSYKRRRVSSPAPIVKKLVRREVFKTIGPEGVFTLKEMPEGLFNVFYDGMYMSEENTQRTGKTIMFLFEVEPDKEVEIVY